MEEIAREEQAEIARSIELDAALKAIKDARQAIDKENEQAEQELESTLSEYATLGNFSGLSQEQYFSMKAKNFSTHGEVQSMRQALKKEDYSLAYWRNKRIEQDDNSKAYDGYISGLQQNPWIFQKLELEKEVERHHKIVEEKERQVVELENAKKFKAPKNSVDTKTIEMFRNMVRSGLRLTSNRFVEIPPRNERFPTRAPVESTPTRKQKVVFQSPPTPDKHVELEPEQDDDMSYTHLEFEEEPQNEEEMDDTLQKEDEGEEEPLEEENIFGSSDDNAIHVNITQEKDITPPPTRVSKPLTPPKTPVPTRVRPAAHTPRKNDDHLFKVPELPRQNSPPKTNKSTDDDDINNFLNFDNSPDAGAESQNGANYFNFLGDSNGDNPGAALFSFLQQDGEQHTNTSVNGNFFSFGSSPQAQKKNESGGNNFLF